LDYLLVFYFQYSIRAEVNAISTMNANHRFIDYLVPENGANNTGIFAISTADTSGDIEVYSSTCPGVQSLGGAYFHTRWIFAGSTNYYNESSFHTPNRPYIDTGFR